MIATVDGVARAQSTHPILFQVLAGKEVTLTIEDFIQLVRQHILYCSIDSCNKV